MTACGGLLLAAPCPDATLGDEGFMSLARTCRLSVLVFALGVLAVLATPAVAAPRIFVVAGSGEARVSGSGEPATDAGGPYGDVAPLPGGAFLAISENVVRRVNSHGMITTVAGTGQYGFGGDGGPATRAQLSAPGGLAVLPGGGFLIADNGNHRVRRVDSRGIITTVAGNGQQFPSGDGGPATQAGLRWPTDLAVLPDGGFLVSSDTCQAPTGGCRVRRVDARGIITTVAGTAEEGYSGDGGPATSAKLWAPSALATLPGGGFLIVDSYNYRVRRVDSRGIITTVAGSGKGGTRGNGIPATRAHLQPTGVATLARGGFLIADGGTHRVRRVDSRGIIRTLAGRTTRFPAGGRLIFDEPVARAPWSGLRDRLGGRATSALIDAHDVALEPDGSVLVSGGRHVLLVPVGTKPRLAVALRPPSVARGRIRLNVAASRAGRARIVVRSSPRGTRAAAFTRRVRRGVTTIRLPRLRRGPFVVRIVLRRGRAIATDQTVVFSGRILPKSLARAAVAYRCCGGGPAVRLSAQAAQGESPPVEPRVTSCRRLSRARVDCDYITEDNYAGSVAVTLRDALVHLTAYQGKRHGPARAAPLL